MTEKVPPEAIDARRRALAMIGAIDSGQPVWKYMVDDLKDYKTGGNASSVPITFEAYRQEGLKAQSAALIAYWAMQKVELATGQSIAAQIAEYGEWLNDQDKQ
ncbi:hypothetical protein [Mycobacterium paragordonae]|nr:hypothetical protein [Mycobacterium paragordonae]